MLIIYPPNRQPDLALLWQGKASKRVAYLGYYIYLTFIIYLNILIFIFDQLLVPVVTSNQGLFSGYILIYRLVLSYCSKYKHLYLAN